MREPAADAELALLLEVASTPKPGNVDRHREYDDLRFEHFLAGSVGARPGLERAVDGAPVGAAFEGAIEGMSAQTGGNTQFGAVLLLAALVAAASDGELTRETARRVVESTTVEDAVAFYRAFDHVDVAVDEPPADVDVPDVRRGSDAATELQRRDLTLSDVMRASADVDGLAAEYVSGFPRTFDSATTILDGSGPVTDRAAAVYLDLLATEPDTFVVTQHDRETARDVQQGAQAVQAGERDAEAFAEDLVARDVNPGTTADIVAGALYVALRRGLQV